MINPFDDSWQYGQVDSSTAYGCSPMDPAYAPEAFAAGVVDPMNSVHALESSSSIDLHQWQPHSWDYTTSSMHSDPYTASQQSGLGTVEPYGSELTQPEGSISGSLMADPYGAPEHTILASSSHSCHIHVSQRYHQIYMNNHLVGTYNGHTFYWRNGHLAGTWNCNTHHAYGPHNHDLGYAGSWNRAAVLIYHQTR